MVGEFSIGFIDDQEDIVAKAVAETEEVGARHARAGGIAGVGDEDEAGVGLDGRKKREIEPTLSMMRRARASGRKPSAPYPVWM